MSRRISSLLGLLLLSWSLHVFAKTPVPILTVADTINPGTADFLRWGIERAEADKAPFVVIQLDTPGGLLQSTREIVQKILNSPLPIVVYISPKGAHAGSAGALITFAADVAVMAPGTNIGAAHPVSVGSDQMDSTMADKIANDTAAFAESLAKAKGRNTEWAIQAVKKSASIIAEEALKKGVINLIADDTSDLLEKLEGYTLKVPKGTTRQLAPGPLAARTVEIPLKYRLLSFFADPNLAYMIMSLGGLCIWVELTHPGLILPGVVGAICILLSLISFHMLPISYGALGLLGLGMAMCVAELYLPTYGLLGLAGLACFIVGSVFLMDSATPEFAISLSIILPVALSLAAMLGILALILMRSRKTRVRSGLAALIGNHAQVRERVGAKEGKVLVEGELWNAISKTGESFDEGSLVVVDEVRGMLLVVVKPA